MLKIYFEQKFIFKTEGLYYGVQVLDGLKTQIRTITANPLLLLWASITSNGKQECILERKYIDDYAIRGFLDDLFDPEAGIRTMSTKSHSFNPNPDSYHNGSFWPIINSLIIEGLENFGFAKQAASLTQASLLPILHFQTPIELYVKIDQGYSLYQNRHGQTSCLKQAWSAAALLDMTAGLKLHQQYAAT